jgi:hypothetical protein
MKPASGLLALTFHLAIVSSISFGGFPTVLPDVRAFVVSTHGWITDQDFGNGLARGAPVSRIAHLAPQSEPTISSALGLSFRHCPAT